LIVTAQHIDPIKVGRGMGHILPEAVKCAGADATFLNHAENPLTQADLTKAIERANEVGLITIVCADSLKDAEIIAHLQPDIIVCEQTELIGTGRTADTAYMQQSNDMVKAISATTHVLQAAGISTPKDVTKAIRSGADGTGGTSGIVCADDPKAVLLTMLQAMKEGMQ
jgi:triosephosphate isomerase